jgi:hypothetical protein
MWFMIPLLMIVAKLYHDRCLLLQEYGWVFVIFFLLFFYRFSVKFSVWKTLTFSLKSFCDSQE